MIGPQEFLLGGGVPFAAAAATLAIVWLLTRRAGAAWSAGVIVGFAAGAAAIDSPGAGVRAAALGLVRPHESHQWLPMLGLLAALPAIAGLAPGRWRGVRWLLAAAIVAAAPLWMLWGGKYLPSAELRDAGFTASAWSAGTAALIVSGVAAAMLAAWAWWEAAEASDLPLVRSLLVVVALVGAAAVAALTGSLTHGQWLGALAATIGGCAAMAWLLRAPAGPEAAAGPILLVAGCLVMLATLYSEMKPLQGAALWLAIALAAGPLPGLRRLPAWGRGAVRTVVCLTPLLLAVGSAVADHRAAEEELRKEAESNPYLNL